MFSLNDFYDNDILTHRAKAVYIYLSIRKDKEEGISWPSIQTISKELSLSVSTVKRAIEDLRELKYIETEQRWRDNGGKSSLLFRLLK